MKYVAIHDRLNVLEECLEDTVNKVKALSAESEAEEVVEQKVEDLPNEATLDEVLSSIKDLNAKLDSIKTHEDKKDEDEEGEETVTEETINEIEDELEEIIEEAEEKASSLSVEDFGKLVNKYASKLKPTDFDIDAVEGKDVRVYSFSNNGIFAADFRVNLSSKTMRVEMYNYEGELLTEPEDFELTSEIDEYGDKFYETLETIEVE